jgi:Mg2+-importing ATPase
MADDARAWAVDEGKKGSRVLAIAWKEVGAELDVLSEKDETGVQVLGMIAFHDPLKASAVAAVATARELGVQVKIITGDAREVAGWVGFGAGILADPGEVITGEELDKLSQEEKLSAVERYHVFARTMPLQKNGIITLLKEKHLVGFLGEGFNDAPALKAAHVGLAVANASDIAQDAADVVLLNPSLTVIIDGIREGRKIFANSMKYLRITLASNFGNFYALALSSLFIPFLPMLPIQVLLLNLLSDFPMMMIATDNVDDEELEKPRGYQVVELTSVAVVLGIVSTIFDFAFFGYFQQFGEAVLQTMWFLGSILTELVAIYTIRTKLPFWRARRPAWGMTLLTGTTALITISLPFIPLARELFHLIPAQMRFLYPALALVAGYFLTTEVAKLLFYHLWKTKDSREAGLAST